MKCKTKVVFLIFCAASAIVTVTSQDDIYVESPNGCVTPPHPENGFHLSNGRQAAPNQNVEKDSYLMYVCYKGFKLIGEKRVFCEGDGNWSQLPECKRVCTSLSSSSVDTWCKYKGKTIDCSNDLPSGTIVSLSCKRGFEPIQDKLDDLVCLDGSWSNQIPFCRASTETRRTRCLLPEYPTGGTYEPKTKKPGMYAELYMAISYNCKENYELIPVNSKVIFCTENGTWSGQPKCLRACKQLSSLTVDMACEYQNREIDCSAKKLEGFKVYTTCKPLHRKVTGTSDVLTCVNGTWDNVLPQCDLDCGEEKGYAGKQLVLNGTTETRLNSPWHVGIYTHEKNNYEQICGGTIISTKLVISAAHCFGLYNRRIDVKQYALAAGKLYRAWDHNEIDTFSYIQRKKIEKVYVHPKYNGFENNLQGDIAIIIIDIPFEFSLSVHAACMETDNFFVPNYGVYGKLVGWGLTVEGVMTSAATDLQRADIPLIDEETCVSGVPAEFIKFVKTLGKFCAGTTKEGATACNGDSGGGILFNRLEDNIQRWYLKGIVSVASKDDSMMTCTSHSYTVFTNVSSHIDFLRRIIQVYSDGCTLPIQPKNGKYILRDSNLEAGFIVPEYTVIEYQCNDGYEPDPDIKSHCLDGNWNATVVCNYVPGIGSKGYCVLPEYPKHGSYLVGGKLIAPGNSVEPLTLLYYVCDDGYVVRGDSNVFCEGGKWSSNVKCVDCGKYPSDGSPGTPWAVGIYKKKGSQFRYHCGGTILTDKIVISAAHCFLLSFGTIVESNFFVAVGKYYRRWNPSEENENPYITYSAVSKIHIPEEYRGFELDWKHDIALLVLVKTLKFTDHLRPICYNFVEDQFKELPGTIGKTVGWGFTTSRMNNKYPATLSTYAMTAIDFDTCRSKASQWLRRLITADKICALWVNNTDMCRNGKGDGFIFNIKEKNEDRWYLRGVSSTSEEDASVMCSKSYSFFTDISKFQNFIENIVEMY